MQESHLRLSSGFLIPNNIGVSANNAATGTGFYVGLGWFVTTDFGNESI